MKINELISVTPITGFVYVTRDVDEPDIFYSTPVSAIIATKHPAKGMGEHVLFQFLEMGEDERIITLGSSFSDPFIHDEDDEIGIFLESRVTYLDSKRINPESEDIKWVLDHMDQWKMIRYLRCKCLSHTIKSITKDSLEGVIDCPKCGKQAFFKPGDGKDFSSENEDHLLGLRKAWKDVNL